jgi:hypothetical protein
MCWIQDEEIKSRYKMKTQGHLRIRRPPCQVDVEAEVDCLPAVTASKTYQLHSRSSMTVAVWLGCSQGLDHP